jgi:uncharacterized protein (UPF0333 family)
MTLYVVTIYLKETGFEKSSSSTYGEVRDAVEAYNNAVIDPRTLYAYLSETWATFMNMG